MLFLDITPNTDEDGQAMKDGVHVSFAVLRTSKEEADATARFALAPRREKSSWRPECETAQLLERRGSARECRDSD